MAFFTCRHCKTSKQIAVVARGHADLSFVGKPGHRKIPTRNETLGNTSLRIPYLVATFGIFVALASLLSNSLDAKGWKWGLERRVLVETGGREASICTTR